MAVYLLGADYGTGGAKMSLINDQGEVVAYAFEEYPFITEHPGWSEHDPHRYWQIFCRMSQKVLTESKADPKEIRGIALSSALPSLVMIDHDGNPIHRAYNLMDRRATDSVEWIKDNLGDERVFKISGNRLEDHPTLVNLLWEKNHRSDSYQRIYKALTIDGFIAFKLTGKATLHYSGAAFYGVAYNLLERAFDQQILAEMGINPDILPTLVACEDIIGEITTPAAIETGLHAGTPVAGGQVDCNAGWVGGGAIAPGDIQMNLGTCGNFGVLHQNRAFPFTPTGYAMINFAYTVDSEKTFITVPTTTTGGQSLRYIRDNFSPLERQAEETFGLDAYGLLNLQAQQVAPGSEGLIVLPFLMGERTPIWDIYARGVVFGLSLNHGKGHLVRATMEGVAYALYDSYRMIMASGLGIEFPLVLNEGGAKSSLWRSIITNVFNIDTVLVKRRTGAPFGDAILAGVATGVFPDFGVAKQWVEYEDPMQPDLRIHEQYMAYFAVFKDIYEHVREDFRSLARLRAIGQ